MSDLTDSRSNTGQRLLEFLNTPVAMTALSETKSTVDATMKTTLYIGMSVVLSFGLNRIVTDILDIINKTYTTFTVINKYNETLNKPETE